MPKFKDNALDAILYCLHSQGKSTNEANVELQKLTGEDPMSLERVKLFFENVDKGRFSLKEPTLEENIQMAFSLPSVQRRIMANTNLETRLALRSTSRLFRQLSFDHPFHLKKLVISHHRHRFLVLADDGFKRTLLESRVALPSDSKARDELECYLSNILKFRKFTVDTLFIWLSEEKADFALNCMKTVFREYEFTPVCVGNFRGDTISIAKFLSLVPYFNPDHLTSIRIVSFHDYNDEMDEVQDVFELEAWKKASAFKSRFNSYPIKFIENCLHFPFCMIGLVSPMGVEMFMKLKEKLLENSQLRQFKIYTDEEYQIRKVQQIREAIGARSAEWVNFQYPDGLKLSVSVTKELIWFKGPCYDENEEEEDEKEDEEESDDDEEADEEEAVSSEDSGDEDSDDDDN